jgi:hypothetical protein
MKFACPHDCILVTPETCLRLQRAWENEEKVPCGGSRCCYFVCDCVQGQREQLAAIYRIEAERLQAEERKDPMPPEIGG